jgi:orotidine-5'-phosphate decarboxylase
VAFAFSANLQYSEFMAKVFVPLDFPDGETALHLARKLVPINPWVKVGLELYVAEGPGIIERLKGIGARVFLDLKFHDIPNTVAGAVRSSVRLGVDYLNIHCGGGAEMIRAAVDACGDEAAKHSAPAPVLLGVTVLTSLDDQGIQAIGFPRSASAQVKHFTEMAMDGGLGGVVCSAEELPLIRALAGKSFVTMVPGIRPVGSSAGDQKRVFTPAEAVRAGADCLVVGRPITGAKDPLVALSDVLKEAELS